MSSIAPFPDVIPIEQVEPLQQPRTRKRVIRRRPSPTQGRALEKLGHAIEYLVDSRMALIHEPSTRADAEALNILMELSRGVFAECEEMISVRERVRAWIAGKRISRARQKSH